MSILKAFTNHLVEFADEIKKVFPGDPDLRTGIIFLKGLIKINPKTIIQGWKECVNDPYKEKILVEMLVISLIKIIHRIYKVQIIRGEY